MKKLKQIKIITGLKAQPGDKVIAGNYRNNRWENGEVLDIQISLSKTGKVIHSHTSYRVMLDRKSKNGNLIFITVGDDQLTRPLR